MNIFITGSVGSGKSTFRECLMKYLDPKSFDFLDLDQEAKKIINEHNIEIPEDRTSLFNDQLHLFYVEKKVWSYLSLPKTKKHRVIEASTFFECPGLFNDGDIIINISSKNCEQRVITRDKEDRANLINKNQLSQFTKNLCSDYVVKNDSDINFLDKKAKFFAENLNYQQTEAFNAEVDFIKEEWRKNFPELSKKLINNIIKEYTRIDRSYHNQSHLVYLLKSFNQHIRDDIPLKLWKRAVALAIFYHDAKMQFDPIINNEADSIRFMFEQFKNENLISSSVIGARSYVMLAADLILSTRTHKIDQYITSSDNGRKYTELFLDLDLLILSDKENFNAYENGVRNEWLDFTDQEYCMGRKNVLETISKDDVYKSALFSDRNILANELITETLRKLS